jgi:hypothetical protein
VYQDQAIGAIVIGSILIIASFFLKKFYAAGGTPAAVVSDRRTPTWMGRLIFWAVGGMMLLVGIVCLLPNR